MTVQGLKMNGRTWIILDVCQEDPF